MNLDIVGVRFVSVESPSMGSLCLISALDIAKLYLMGLRTYKKILAWWPRTPPTGFGLGSLGRYPNRAYGLSLCRGDVSANDCRTCLVNASTEITKRCPNDRGAIIWYDNCYLKYLDDDFLGKIDTQNRFYMWNLNNVSINPQIFNQKTRELLSKLSENSIKTTKMFAKGEVEVGVGEYAKIYGMVQCSRDLSRVDCKKCVDDAISELPRCCGGKQGGRVVGGSCNIRYETYPFINL
ncbi:hypothetical protein DH2020_022817 [Rehmannia glutinosa]|uniref:Gnk2-homologous domain-containing protein n=1 Tax=Rehmannia glutinosa TaxID=99300 RepID=A0ABR0W807_REHGL